MALQFPCSQCGQTLKVDDRFAGAKIRCPACRAISAAPAEAAPPATSDASTADRKSPSAETAKVKRSKSEILDTFEEIEPVDFGKREREEGELDMTPMVDVVFLLLIFFMVTAAFSMQKSLEVPTPDEDKASTQQRIVDPEDGNIVVRIDQDSTIWVNESEAPSEQDLLVKLREARRGQPGGDSRGPSSLLVMADGDALHEVVIMVLDAGNSVQMEPIRLVTVDDNDF